MKCTGENRSRSALRPARGQGGVATLTLNRGDRMNPLSTAMLSALQAELDRVAKDGTRRSSCSPARASISAPGTTCARCARTPGKAWQKALFEQCSEMMLCSSACPSP